MKYYKTTKFPKLIASSGFIAIVACALIAIGAIGWFALSNNSVSQAPSTPKTDESYLDNTNSYNNEVYVPPIDETTSENVNESVSDIPYTESSEPEVTEIEKPTYILPVTGNISKGFSDTALQYSATFDDMRLHTGVDILCKKGTDIKSVGSGNVISIVDDSAFGKVVSINYSDNITVKYCGLDSVNIKENDKIVTGDVIGTSGEIPSECADNPHIHIEVIVDGKTVSPFSALGLE